jgi:hypothetical protein
MLAWRDLDRTEGNINLPRRKTAACVVPLSLSPRLTEVLDRQPRRIGSELVFTEPGGAPADVDWLNRTLEGAMATAGIPKTRGVLWNLLRKTAASRFYQNGGLPQDEADIAGHSIDIAMRHYREFSRACLKRVAGATEAPTVTPTVTTPSEAQQDAVTETRQVS